MKELHFIIENGSFRSRVELVDGDEVVPSMLIFKAKITSCDFLGKLKVRCVTRGDLQVNTDHHDNLWSPCAFAYLSVQNDFATNLVILKTY